MEKEYLPKEQYDAVMAAYKERYNYDDMSDEEKERFDERLDKVVAVKEEDEVDKSSDKETTDQYDETDSRETESETYEEADGSEDPDNVDADEGGADSDDPDVPVKKLVRRR